MFGFISNKNKTDEICFFWIFFRTIMHEFAR